MSTMTSFSRTLRTRPLTTSPSLTARADDSQSVEDAARNRPPPRRRYPASSLPVGRPRAPTRRSAAESPTSRVPRATRAFPVACPWTSLATSWSVDSRSGTRAPVPQRDRNGTVGCDRYADKGIMLENRVGGCQGRIVVSVNYAGCRARSPRCAPTGGAQATSRAVSGRNRPGGRRPQLQAVVARPAQALSTGWPDRLEHPADLVLAALVQHELDPGGRPGPANQPHGRGPRRPSVEPGCPAARRASASGGRDAPHLGSVGLGHTRRGVHAAPARARRRR